MTFTDRAAQRNLDVNVRGASLIPARVDRRERHLAITVRRLNASQEGLRLLRAVLGVVAGRIHVPDFNQSRRGPRVARYAKYVAWRSYRGCERLTPNESPIE